MQQESGEEGNNTGKIGKFMTFAAWILVLIIATLYFDRFLDQQHNPNQDPQAVSKEGLRELTLQRNRQGHYVSNGRINGEKVRFFLDTGATDVSIPETVASRLWLHRGPELDVITANGTISVYMTMLDRIQIDDIELRNVRASINPYMDGEEILLGMSFLKHLEFTQRGDQLILRQYD
ncbi:MAG: TIGR02281 family clan AA aspartic protease [Gammaproteobacteria bacterium]|nr:TIGR02281 family clan AA aspartic protease [Gammaproteobacteria bacterium]